MPPTAPIPFWKVAGGANDYVVLDGRDGSLDSPLEPGLVRSICARRWGIGSDGILFVRAAREGGDYRLDFYNPDGSTHGLCGNGARCVARLAMLEGWAGCEQEIELDGGSLRAEIGEASDAVRIHLEPPVLRGVWEGMPVGDGSRRATLVWIRVPHLIVELEGEPELASLDVDAAGRRLREHEAFGPDGTNVDFVAVTAPSRARIRTYERGVEGETLACGSGSVAAAAALLAAERVGSPVTLTSASDTDLVIDFGEGTVGEDAAATLEGDARMVARGILGPDLLPSAREGSAR